MRDMGQDGKNAGAGKAFREDQKIIESVLKQDRSIWEQVEREDTPFLEEPYLSRRTDAILHRGDKVRRELGGLGLKDGMRSFSAFELMPYASYEVLNEYGGDLQIAASLWVLDALRKNNKLREAEKILPDETQDENFFDLLPLEFFHSCYSEELIGSVIRVFRERYTGKYGDNNPVLCAEAARKKRPEERYRKILELLPRDEVEQACRAFRDKQWELTRRVMACHHALEQKIRDAFDMALAGTASGSADLLDDRSELTGQLTKLQEQNEILDHVLPTILTEDRREVGKRYGKEIADLLGDFCVDDPYEICFALYYLTDMEDDAPWLMNSGYLMVCKACLMLPWVRDQRNWTGEQIDEWLTPLSYDYNGWLDEPQREQLPDLFHTYYRGLNLAQYVYGISHCVLPSGYCHPFQKERKELMQGGVDEKTADFAILMAEMSFLQAFRENPARFCREDLAVYQQIAEQEEAQQAARVPSGGYWGKLAGKAGITPDTKDQEEKQRIQDLQDQLSEAKRENEALRNELAALRKKSRKEESEREEERRISIQEHRELADLRELVFCKEQGEEPEGESAAPAQVVLPYSVRKKTVVFGGHESFRKAIKPLLPDVRFVDAGRSTFSPDLVRNADVVWLQTNRMSHSQFYQIAALCRGAGIQMRYFTSASAEKCAVQLAEEDTK